MHFPANGLLEIEVTGRSVCIGRDGDNLRGCAAKCPHAGGKLAEGYLDGQGNIVCPLHGFKFDLSNGRNVTGEGYQLRTYPIEVRGDGIYIGIDEVK